jgi:hypothetical protein
VNDPSSQAGWRRPRQRLAGRVLTPSAGRGSPAPPFTAGDGWEAGASPLEGCLRTPGTGAPPLPPTETRR